MHAKLVALTRDFHQLIKRIKVVGRVDGDTFLLGESDVVAVFCFIAAKISSSLGRMSINIVLCG